MPKKKKLPRDQFINAAADSLSGKSIRQLTKDYDMSERDARWLSRNQGLCAEEFRELVINRMQVLQEELLDKIRERIDEIPAGQLAVTYGILSDKMNRAQPSINNLHLTQKVGVQINGETLSREELIKRVNGTKEVIDSEEN
jgi:hypothetical protein